tara:strand:+ start:16841 stop:17293 length:453 start_codon:yes stop_codon:yes gene_type:complete
MKKKIIIVGLGFVGMLTIASTVLLLHINDMNKRNAAFNHSKTIQLAKITFEQVLIDEYKTDIHDALVHTNGYKNHRYSDDGKSVVFMYDKNLNPNNSSFFREYTSKTILIDGQLYEADANLMANGCPVMDKNSISYRISSGFEKLAAKLF